MTDSHATGSRVCPTCGGDLVRTDAGRGVWQGRVRMSGATRFRAPILRAAFRAGWVANTPDGTNLKIHECEERFDEWFDEFFSEPSVDLTPRQQAIRSILDQHGYRRG